MYSKPDRGIREIIDPDGTLPQITVEPLFAEESEGHYHSYNIYYDGEVVGGMDIFRSWQEADSFENIVIRHKVVKGLGLAAYTWAIAHSQEQGRGFSCAAGVSAQARRIWEILAQKGAAEVVQPFKEVHGSDGAESFTTYEGYYYVAPPLVTSIS